MFRFPNPQIVRRAVQRTGQITPLGLPLKGMNAQAPFSMMSSEYAIGLFNVTTEAYGLRTRKGYTEWATGLANSGPVWTLMAYYPDSAGVEASPAAGAGAPLIDLLYAQVYQPAIEAVVTAPKKLFAARGNNIFDVSVSGSGPYTPEASITGSTAFWTHINFQNSAGSFLLVANEDGGYGYYDGTAWVMPTMGVGVGQIGNVDPSDLAFVMEWKRRVWFVEKESTNAWYLDVEAITGPATVFDFGAEFPHGGYLVALANWTVDSGAGIDDRLVAVGSQGDVTIYEGTDPDDPTQFRKMGTWYVGPLPKGRRCVTSSGGDVNILTQFGVMPVSRLQATAHLPVEQQQHLTYMVDPIINRLMQMYAAYDGWRIIPLAREELMLIQMPEEVLTPAGTFFALKVPSRSWSILRGTLYADLLPVDQFVFAGSTDGRVLQAFNGPLDNVLLASPTTGTPIQCQVVTAYNAQGASGQNKIIHLVRPTFLVAATPALLFQVLSDYQPPQNSLVPYLPSVAFSLWDTALWDVGVWGGVQTVIKEWLGSRGVGFANAVQFDYLTGGDTMLMSIDLWSTQGNVL